MRVLFVNSALASHLFPMVPLASALREAGHEVEFAAPPDVAWEAHRVGPATEHDRVFARVLRTPAGPKPGVPRVLGLFAEAASAMAADLAALLERRRPDLVVFEPMALAAPLAARRAGIPSVRFRFGPDLLERFFPQLLDDLPPALVSGAGPDALAGGLTLDPCPAGLGSPSVAPVWPIRYTPAWPGDGDAPRGTGFRVCVSWGSTLFRVAPDRFLAGDAARAVAPEADTVFVVVRREQVDTLGTLPSNVVVLPDVPLHRVLAHSDLLVGHGGAGTILTGAAAGLPQLHLPQLPDHKFHAAALAATGAGQVVASVGELAVRPELPAARELAASIAAAPAPDETAAKLAVRA